MNGNWTYSYDPFNRLTGSNENSSTVIYAYAYDRFGNRWTQQPTTGTGASSSLGFDANNRIVSGFGVSYDAAGNVMNDGSHTYFYDAEDHIIQVGGTLGTCSSATACYTYDSEGRRANKTTGGTSVDYVYDLGDHEISEFNSSAGLNRGEIYAGSRHLGTYESGLTYFSYADWLGTERVRAAYSGGTPETCTSLPFGDWLTCSGTDVSPMHFTGKERDSESNLDNFGARYDSSQMGRFMSPDDPFADQHTDDPQSWNLYSYVRNNPLTFNDPDGQACVQQSDGTYKDDDSGGQSCSDAAEPQKFEVKTQAPPAVETFLFNLFNAVDNLANDFFSPFLGGNRPSYMQNTQIGNGFVAQAGGAVGAVGAALIGPAGEAEGGVRITEAGLAHVLERHAAGGGKTLGKSLFSAGEDIKGLIQAAGSAPARNSGGALIRTVDAGRTIGFDRVTGQATSVYTVITKSSGELITAYPGRP